MPLCDAHREIVLSSRVIHADETPIALLDPGGGKTRRAYIWASVSQMSARCLRGRAGRSVRLLRWARGRTRHRVLEALGGHGVVDAYSGYDAALSLNGAAPRTAWRTREGSSTNS